uniref:Prominin-like protein n=1 Tax=Taenia asiatica TaxID=60517 RepID=A0A0R3VW95_TAEAS
LEVVAETAGSYLARLNDLVAKYISSDSSYIAIGNEYILYSGFAFLCLPAFIILLFYLGLSFGVCGDRPHEEASFCNRGVGANLLLSGVVFTFLLSSLLMLACTVVFLSGGLMQTEICRYATHHYPAGPAVLDDALEVFAEYQLRQGVRLSTNSPSLAPNVSQHLKNLATARPFSVLLTRCANESLVDSLGDKVVGMMVSDTSIDNFLESILATFNGIDLISPLRRTAADTLNTLNEVHDLQRYNFSEALMKAEERLTEIEDFDNYVSQLQSLNIENLNDQILALQETVGLLSLRLKTPIRQLYGDLQSIRGYYNQLVDELNRFSSELDRTVPTSIEAQIESMRPLFLKELRLAVIASWRDIPCTRLYSAATTGVHAACITFLDPLNGLWFGLGLFLLLCIPVLVLGVKLVNLYRRTEKYSPDYEQPDYISYHAFYMRPATSDGDVQSRRKHRPRKGKLSTDRSHGKADNGSAYGFSHRHGPASNSTYQTVSVYPYDAYE